MLLVLKEHTNPKTTSTTTKNQKSHRNCNQTQNKDPKEKHSFLRVVNFLCYMLPNAVVKHGGKDRLRFWGFFLLFYCLHEGLERTSTCDLWHLLNL